MSSHNKVTLVGRLGRDPEIRYTQSQTPYARFSVATSEKFKDKSGEQREKTQWHNCVAWGRLAEVIGQYLKKGSLVLVDGSIDYRTTEKNGYKVTYTDIKVGDIKFLDLKSSGGGQRNQGQQSSGQGYGNTPSSDDFNDDDIPF